MESDREFVNAADEPKKEQDCLHEDLNGHRSLADEASYGFKIKIEENGEDIHLRANGEQKDAPYSQYHIEKVLNNEIYKESNSLDVSGFQVRANGIARKGKDRYELLAETLGRTRITESHEVKLTIEKVEEVDPSNSTLKPLEVVEEIVLKLYDFMDHIFLMLKDGQRVEFQQQDRFDLLDRADRLLENLSQRIRRVNDEMEHMKNDENQKEDYSHTETRVHEIFNQLLEIIACLVERSFNLGVASLLHHKCTENELSSCVGELNQSKEELGVIISGIRELKGKKMDTFWENELTEMQEGIKELESEKLKQICVSNGPGSSYAVPRLTGGFER